jgi:hypothetical protein
MAERTRADPPVAQITICRQERRTRTKEETMNRNTLIIIWAWLAFAGMWLIAIVKYGWPLPLGKALAVLAFSLICIALAVVDHLAPE